MSMKALACETPQDVYARLMAARWGDRIEETLARIIASWSLDEGVLPEWLGLGESGFLEMMECHFPGYEPARLSSCRRSIEIWRSDEMEDLRELLRSNRSGRVHSELWMADIVVAGCMGEDHLWQDLGLWNRADLSRLMLENFELLAKRNERDMKWKKFLYKQLCESEGIYICRAPSCEVCIDYQNCFGSEE